MRLVIWDAFAPFMTSSYLDVIELTVYCVPPEDIFELPLMVWAGRLSLQNPTTMGSSHAYRLLGETSVHPKTAVEVSSRSVHSYPKRGYDVELCPWGILLVIALNVDIMINRYTSRYYLNLAETALHVVHRIWKIPLRNMFNSNSTKFLDWSR